MFGAWEWSMVGWRRLRQDAVNARHAFGTDDNPSTFCPDRYSGAGRPYFQPVAAGFSVATRVDSKHWLPSSSGYTIQAHAIIDQIMVQPAAFC